MQETFFHESRVSVHKPSPFSEVAQPSTLSLNARHTTAFWCPLYSLLISPVSTHHNRARLSEDAVGSERMQSVSDSSVFDISDKLNIKGIVCLNLPLQLSAIYLKQKSDVYEIFFNALTGNDVLGVSGESAVPHPASRRLSWVVALDAELCHQGEIGSPPDLAGLICRARGQQAEGQKKVQSATNYAKKFTFLV